MEKNKEPLILKLNAHPGLYIQIASNSGILSHLKMLEQDHKGLAQIADRVAFSKEHFGKQN